MRPAIAKRPLISSVRSELTGARCHVTVYNRGMQAGVLVVDRDDAAALLKRLIPHGCQTVDGAVVTRWALAEATVQRQGYTLTATQDDDDRSLVRIALNGEHVETVGWDPDGFTAWDLRPTPITAENEDARDALRNAYAEALAHMPEID